MLQALRAFFNELNRAKSDNVTQSEWLASLIKADKTHVAFFKNTSTEITLNSMNKGDVIPREIHAAQDQIVLVLTGELGVTKWIGDSTTYTNVKTGDSVVISAGTPHELTAIDDNVATKFMSVYAQINSSDTNYT